MELSNCRFFFVRAGMMGWLFINLSVLAKSIQDDTLSKSMILFQLFCAVISKTCRLFFIDWKKLLLCFWFLNFSTFIPAIHLGLLCTWRVHDIHVSYIFSTRRLLGSLDSSWVTSPILIFIMMTCIQIVVNQILTPLENFHIMSLVKNLPFGWNFVSSSTSFL